MISYEECECHPLPSFLFFRLYECRDYVQDISVPVVGRAEIILARPWKGKKDVGFYVKVFGHIVIVTVRRKAV